jgi:hypothetical protein
MVGRSPDRRGKIRRNKVVGNKSMDEPWVIRKRGAFYRPESIGYTGRIYEAGIFSRVDAEHEASTDPSITAHPLAEFRGMVEAELAQAKSMLAILDSAAARNQETPSTHYTEDARAGV